MKKRLQPWQALDVSIRRADHDTWEHGTSQYNINYRFQSAGRITIPGNPILEHPADVTVFMFQSAGRITIPGNRTPCAALLCKVSIRRADHDTWELKILRGSNKKWFQSAGRITIPGNQEFSGEDVAEISFQSAGRITIPGNCMTVTARSFHNGFQSAGRITIPGNFTDFDPVLVLKVWYRFNPPGGSRYLGTITTSP